VAQDLGIVFSHPFTDVTHLGLEEIARYEQFRFRWVTLKSQWWMFDNGPLLAYHKNTNQPYALLPKHNGYIIVDPETLLTETVNSTNANYFKLEACCFYRSLASRVILFKDLIQFTLSKVSKDVFRIISAELLINIFVLIVPIATVSLFSGLFEDLSHLYLWQWLYVLLVSSLSIAILNISKFIADIRLRAKFDVGLQSALWDRILSLSVHFFRKFQIGDLYIRSSVIDGLIQNVSPAVLNDVANLIFSMVPLALMFYYNMQLAIITVLFTVVLIFIHAILFKLQLKSLREVLHHQGLSSGWIQQALNSISKLFSTNAQTRIFSLWDEHFKKVIASSYKAGFITAIVVTININAPIILILGIYYLVASNTIPCSFSQFVGFNAAYTVFSVMILNAIDAISKVIINIPYYELASPFLSTVPERIENSIDPGLLRGKIQLEHIAFGYQQDVPVLHNINLTVTAGQFVALMGASGCGKSTLFRLLIGFEQPWSGRILYDDQDICTLDIVRLRAQIGMVLQSDTLFSGTIFENISCVSNITLDEAWALAQFVHLDAQIMKMPMKMHTYVSEWGKTFSAGQRQRLLLARALSNKPNILFLDEATSALDNSTQAIVHRHLQQQHMTRVVIAQRIDAVKNADIIYVFKDGRIVESGTYQQLASSGTYFSVNLI